MMMVLMNLNLFLIFKEKGFYKYGAMDRRYQFLRPSNLIMWEGIRKCRDIGCTVLNLGRTEMHHHGLLQYKQGFGCQKHMIRYFRYELKKKAF